MEALTKPTFSQLVSPSLPRGRAAQSPHLERQEASDPASLAEMAGPALGGSIKLCETSKVFPCFPKFKWHAAIYVITGY